MILTSRLFANYINYVRFLIIIIREMQHIYGVRFIDSTSLTMEGIS